MVQDRCIITMKHHYKIGFVFVGIKYEISTPRQTHNYESILFQFIMGDYVPKYTNPAKFGSDLIR